MDLQFLTFERAAGLALVLGDVVLFPGLMMFWLRRGHRGGAPKSRAHYVWERAFILGAIILTAIGFVLLEGPLQITDGRVLARMGSTAYLFAGILGVAAEALFMTIGYDKVYSVVNVYVVLAFLAQAAIGGAVIQSGLLAAWIGWVAILWNIAWLIVLPILTPRDIYFPVVHHFAPLLLGIALLWKGL